MNYLYIIHFIVLFTYINVYDKICVIYLNLYKKMNICTYFQCYMFLHSVYLGFQLRWKKYNCHLTDLQVL